MKELAESLASQLVIKDSLESGLEQSIRLARPNDINDDYINSLNDSKYVQYSDISPKNKFTKTILKQYITEQQNSKTSCIFGLLVSNKLVATSRISIGFSGYSQGVLVFKSYNGLGYGSMFVRAVSDHVLKQLGCSVLYAGIVTENIASIKLFAKAGFTVLRYEDSGTKQVWHKINRHI